MNDRTALVLGATGGIGGAVAKRLAVHGYRVRALHRRPERVGRDHDGLEWVAGDALDAASVRRAAADASLIVHAVNPPGYRHWGRLVLPMLASTIAAAAAVGARILLPGTVYNYGPDVFAGPIGEDAPQNPTTAKGRIRVEMERRLEAAAAAGTPVLIVRAGDFFGPGAANNWFSQGLIRPGRPVTTILRPGARGVGHQWAHLPDLAETMVRLVDRGDDLPGFARFHFAGLWDDDGEALIAAIRRVTGGTARVRGFPWWLVALARPVVPLAREIAEMRYLWRVPVRLADDRLRAFLGDLPATPLDTAVERTLASLGCLPVGGSETA